MIVSVPYKNVCSGLGRIFLIALFFLFIDLPEGISQTPVTLKPVRQHFYGTYSRCAIELGETVNYNIIEDWSGRTITVIFEKGSRPHYKGPARSEYNNLALNSIEIIKENELVKQVVFHTPGEFELKAREAENPFKIILDIHVVLEPVSAENSLKRAKIYRSRNEVAKALKEYLYVIGLEPDNYEAFYNAGEINYQQEKPAIAHSFLSKIPKDSPFFESAKGILQALDEKAGSEADKTAGKTEQPKNPAEEGGKDSVAREQTAFVPGNAENDSTSNAEDISGGVIDSLLSPFSIVIAILLTGSLVLSIYVRYKKKNEREKRKKIARKKARIKKIREKKHQEKIKQFTQKLEEAYKEKEEEKAAEENGGESIFKKPDPRSRNLDLEIDEIVDHSKETEAVKITKAFRDSGKGTEKLADKYQPVYQLADQNYSVRDIARELLMGIEEVKLALSMRSEQKIENLLDEKYGAVYELADQNLSVKDIARQLELGQDEVKLALNLREKNKPQDDQGDIRFISPGGTE